MKNLMKLSATSPFTNFSAWLDEVNATMIKIGPAAAGVAVAICVLCICLTPDEKRTKEYVRRIVLICLAAAVLANITLLIEWAGTFIQYIFGG